MVSTKDIRAQNIKVGAVFDATAPRVKLAVM